MGGRAGSTMLSAGTPRLGSKERLRKADKANAHGVQEQALLRAWDVFCTTINRVLKKRRSSHPSNGDAVCISAGRGAAPALFPMHFQYVINMYFSVWEGSEQPDLNFRA